MPRAKKTDKTVPGVRRAALYIRVSTEEQAKEGYSLPAQLSNLEAYAKEHGYAIAGRYIDAGKSARKKYTSRKEFVRMMDDVKAGLIDVILFIKLDRWFRSVADYYKIQEILDAHGVAWKTTQEQYDTETTNGRLYINIRLSVAQDESDRDSDRIKFVFEDKVARGEAITGSQCLPLGLVVRDKRVVPDPDTAPIAKDLFARYLATGAIGGSARYVREKYGYMLWDQSAKNMLRNAIYMGAYRGNKNYCEPLISPEDFEEVQKLMQSRSVRSNQSGRIYLFSGLIVCAECGKKMSASYTASHGNQYILYRCRQASIYRQCSHHKQMNEENLEKWLLLNIVTELDSWRLDWETRAAQASRPKVDRAAIQRKLSKLKDLYVEEMISLDDYRKDYERYSAQLLAAEEEPRRTPDFAAVRKKLVDFIDIYGEMERQDKQEFWRGIIREIRLDAENNPHVIFCG